MDQTLAARSAIGCRRAGVYALVFAVVWFLVVVAQATEPLFASVWLWPLDAVLAGLLVRYRLAIQPVLCWLLIGAALVLGAYSWDGSLNEAATFAMGHGLPIWVAWSVLVRADVLDGLRKPESTVRVLIAGLVAALVGVVVALMLNPSQWGMDPLGRGTFNAFLGQWLGYCTLLPVILLLPGSRDRRLSSRFVLPTLSRAGALLMPVLVLFLGLVLYFTLRGPGGVAFLIPGLIYGVFVYQLTTTVRMSLIAVMVAILGPGRLGLFVDGTWPLGWEGSWPMASLQIGLLLSVVMPLLLSSLLAARNDLIAALNVALDHDDLTDALSRSAFVRGTQEYLQQLPAAKHGNALMMLDIDHFKALNDNHGHAAGDIVLREFARVIKATIRPGDLFGRLGGEEFGVVLPNTSVQDSLVAAERLRRAVESIRLYYDSDEPLQISVSIGAVHTSQAPRATLDELIEIADEAMYEAKRGGRNRVCLSQGRLRS
ncbi:MAG TPA: GGDEF domain-containing protein [Pusillimonas sp.]|uniref:GGDEF domain-containing protein n=1 Tax=Pusillimonas sp. TaxID=3040095 RepID=UPI002BE49472|nr:GGDEF domain-containing protein [Pusillimonas sp.]HUH87814.1 GGDEF domain-containing protein [Pusillimonas sp.]